MMNDDRRDLIKTAQEHLARQVTLARDTSRARSSYRGFTIVELLVVIVVIAILAGISTVSYAGIRQRADEAAIITHVR